MAVNLPKYLSDTWTELKQVAWPSRQVTIKLTAVVIAISLIVAAYVGGLDYTLTSVLKKLLG